MLLATCNVTCLPCELPPFPPRYAYAQLPSSPTRAHLASCIHMGLSRGVHNSSDSHPNPRERLGGHHAERPERVEVPSWICNISITVWPTSTLASLRPRIHPVSTRATTH
ncbi:hypothetical protein DICSQDRAFT_154562 [Dichomitus squalens LYAD-421 SS1]|uniref:Uncharacterized protein n=2 Tax=Dichomitus squalens TaxID=114155 RepID=A0A4Q9PVT1_9APHY|nr:uncharacterized protein DICSQDRAFT_154562 [Dichomitus squalens LYAD-421 SS1]EJF62135.1 hypothetical protein DICSQDRAFT_154562 [Dichomitus squalens LYAD-421 SS1]TBU58625.1 hypothetical protein BD310DRAFT_818990 [Dichomitus squalens]